MAESRTNIDTIAAQRTQRYVSVDPFCRKAKGSRGTVINTGTAANTFVREADYADIFGYSFRVMTPMTAQGTTFKKDSSSDIGAIVESITLDGKNCGVFSYH